MNNATLTATPPSFTESISRSSTLAQRNYWPEIDGIRAVAFLMVFLCHFVDDSTVGVLQKISSHGIDIAVAARKLGIGVELFFVASGF